MKGRPHMLYTGTAWETALPLTAWYANTECDDVRAPRQTQQNAQEPELLLNFASLCPTRTSALRTFHHWPPPSVSTGPSTEAARAGWAHVEMHKHSLGERPETSRGPAAITASRQAAGKCTKPRKKRAKVKSSLSHQDSGRLSALPGPSKLLVLTVLILAVQPRGANEDSCTF